MKKNGVFLLIALSAFVISNFAFAQYEYEGNKDIENKNESASPGQSYSACGCGCCADIEPVKKCLYHSQGDDLQTIIEQDQKAAKNPECPNMGCSPEIQYSYCD